MRGANSSVAAASTGGAKLQAAQVPRHCSSSATESAGTTPLTSLTQWRRPASSSRPSLIFSWLGRRCSGIWNCRVGGQEGGQLGSPWVCVGVGGRSVACELGDPQQASGVGAWPAHVAQHGIGCLKPVKPGEVGRPLTSSSPTLPPALLPRPPPPQALNPPLAWMSWLVPSGPPSPAPEGSLRRAAPGRGRGQSTG